MEPLSNDLRQRILTAVDNHEDSRRKLAKRFSVNTSTITRLLKLRRETGSIGPGPHGGGVAPALDDEALERLRRLVEEDPDATLEQLRDRMGVGDSLMLICRALKKLGLTRKKKTRRAAERDTLEARRKRRSFRRKVKSIDPRRLVFVDETGVTTAMEPAYGRSPRGERVESTAPASWESTTMVAAMRLGRVRAPLALPGSVNGATFETYVERCLVPTLRRGDVVVFDNLSSHLDPAVATAIEGAGSSVLRLPPYSLEFNPIVEMFSKFKEYLRHVGAREKAPLYDAIAEGLRQVRARDIQGWFRHAGLGAT